MSCGTLTVKVASHENAPMSHVACSVNVYVRPLPPQARSLRSWWKTDAVLLVISSSIAAGGFASLACCGPPDPIPTSGSLLVTIDMRLASVSSEVPVAVTV